LVFGSGERSLEFWRVHLKDRVIKTFPGLLSTNESDTNYQLRKDVDIVSLFMWLQVLIGVTWNVNLQEIFDKLPVASNQGVALASSGPIPSDSIATNTQLFLKRTLVDSDVTKVRPKTFSISNSFSSSLCWC